MQDYQEIPHENVSVLEEKNQQAKQKQSKGVYLFTMDIFNT